MEESMFTIGDYNSISTFVKKHGNDYDVKEDPVSFYFFILDLILDLADDDARDSITDNFYLKIYGDSSGHDRGIDAVYIDNDSEPTTIHFFSFKYAMSYEKTKSFLESTEIDKIDNFLNKLMTKELTKQEINPVLFARVEEIWEIFSSGKDNPRVIIHVASNYQNSFEPSEKTRFEKCIRKYTFFEIDYILAENIIDLITKRNRKIINAEIRVDSKSLFEKTDGNIRALIANFYAVDILRIICDDENIRRDPNFSNYEALKTKNIDEHAFVDNVRIYLKKTSRINTNIFDSALDDENHNFFYYNNGITLTCDNYEFKKGLPFPIVKIENLQVVNGGQTLHALFEALKTDSQKLSTINILSRLYETKNKELSSKIAEYTNSQNPVNNRDIHSIDSLQIKLEKEFEVLGLFYERKRNQYRDKPKNLRIDAEKLGQAVFAFYLEKPSEAKNEKRSIFGTSYDLIFNDDLRAGKAIIAYKLFDFIEGEKTKSKQDIVDKYEELGFISYCTYWILYIIHQLFILLSIEIKEDNVNTFKSIYPMLINIIKEFVSKEKEKKGNIYTHYRFFKYHDIKEYWLNYIKTEEFKQKKNEITALFIESKLKG